MATITVKNIPDDLYLALKQAAEATHRSVNGEIIARIEQTLRRERPDAAAILARARRSRAWTADTPLMPTEIEEAIAAGRHDCD
jgi:plasmid stability protein